MDFLEFLIKALGEMSKEDLKKDDDNNKSVDDEHKPSKVKIVVTDVETKEKIVDTMSDCFILTASSLKDEGIIATTLTNSSLSTILSVLKSNRKIGEKLIKSIMEEMK